MAKLNNELFWPGALVGLLIGLIAGFVVAYWTGESTDRAMLSRDDLRRECIAGSDRACKIYEVDYGRD